MSGMRWSLLIVVAVVVLAFGGYAVADDAAKTVTGKSSCAGCTGAAASCCVLLTDKDGQRWVLTGEGDSLKAAFKARGSGKTMTATLASEAVTKKGKDGKDYKEVKVSDVKIGS